MGDACAKCGGTFHVHRVSPDMDINPIALCMVCLMGIVAGADEIGPGVQVMSHSEITERVRTEERRG